MIKALKLLAVCLTGFICGQSGYATDLTGQHELAAEPFLRADPSEVIRLGAGGKAFLAIHRQAITRATRGGVILMHGRDAWPDAVDILESLCKQLPERGWDTLAMTGPVREPEADLQASNADFHEAVERIRAGVAYLISQNRDRIALIGYGIGATIVLRYLTETPDPSPYAAVIIEATPSATAQSGERSLTDLGKVRIPLLDIVSSHGEPLNNEATKTRTRIMKGNAGYRQTIIADPQNDLKDVEGLLLNRIHGWLSRTAEAIPRSSENQSKP